ncbi:MAG: methyltransferase domain-containing protein [Parvularculaceae bacterium]
MAEIVDRLETVTRDFPLAAFFGAGELVQMLTPACGVGIVVNADLARGRLAPACAAEAAKPVLGPASGRTRGARRRPGCGLIADEERLPIAPESLDLIVSMLTLHSANDLVGALAQARRALKPDGLFLAALFGEETLKELRTAFYAAETELTGGVSPRAAPFASVRDLGSALQRAGFALPVADVDRVSVRYEDPARLIEDLRGMGETNVLHERGRALTREIVAVAFDRFIRDGGRARFDIVYLTGWAPHESQQKPLKPGSARASLQTSIKNSPNRESRRK